MKKLIYLEDAIEAIERRLAEPAYQHTGEDWYVGMNCAESELYGLPTAEPEQRWIPWDSGRFPDDSGTYTVTAYDGATKRVTYAKYQKRLKRWELTGVRAYWRVLAWMPLPEPYREEGD